jgi:hypothetical protein
VTSDFLEFGRFRRSPAAANAAKKVCHKTSGFSASGGGKFVPHPAAGNGTKGDISSERDIKKRRRLCAAHGANNLEIFCRDMCVAKNTSHAASVEGRSPK